MSLYFKKCNWQEADDCQAMADFYAGVEKDTETASVAFPPSFSWDQTSNTSDRQQGIKDRASGSEDYFLIDHGRVIGTCGLIINPSHRLYKAENATVAWLQIVILGRPDRNRGHGRTAFFHLIDRAQSVGATHIEFGVFAQNTTVLRILEDHGMNSYCVGVAQNGSKRFLMAIRPPNLRHSVSRRSVLEQNQERPRRHGVTEIWRGTRD